MKKRALFIKDVIGWTGEAKLYELNYPLEGNIYVIVSATTTTTILGKNPETYIFGCSKDGTKAAMSELKGSEKGHLDHMRALRNAGYTVSPYQKYHKGKKVLIGSDKDMKSLAKILEKL